MRALKLVLLSLIMLTLCAGYLFAGGFALSGIGSKALSLGGAFRGMADDPTAMYWNPAGLGFMDRSSLSITGAGLMPNLSFQNTNAALPGFTTSEITAEKKLWMFPGLFLIKACECKFKFGVGAYVPYGLGGEWDIYDLPQGQFTAYTNTEGDTERVNVSFADASKFPDNEMMSSIGIADIHPTVAYQISEQVSIGAGLSVNYAMMEIRRLLSGPDPFGYALPTTAHMKGNGIGIGANFGLMYKPNDVIQVGLSGKIPSTMKLDGDMDAKLWVSNMVTYQKALGQIMAAHPTNYNLYFPAIHAYANADSAVTYSSTTDIKADLNLPGDLGWGFSWHIKPNWVLNADFTYTFWNTLEKLVVKLNEPLSFDPLQSTETVMKSEWKDDFRVSAGTQYSFSKVDLRGGFFFDQSPVPDYSLTPTFPDTADKYSVNGGLGFHLGQWLLDVNYEHIFFAEREVKVLTPDNRVGIYNSNVNAFNAGLTYIF